MDFSEYRYLVLSDLYRITGRVGMGVLLRTLWRHDAFKSIFWMRTSWYLRNKPLHRFTTGQFARFWYRHYRYKLGISIPIATRVGSGFYIGHFGGIVVNEDAVIGRNCNMSHGVTLGQANRGARKGCPVIGDNVYIGPGVKIVGRVRVGDNVAIGANCVVTRDVPDNAVVVGIPGRVISEDGSAAYIDRTDYDEHIGPAPALS